MQEYIHISKEVQKYGNSSKDLDNSTCACSPRPAQIIYIALVRRSCHHALSCMSDTRHYFHLPPLPTA